MFNPAKMSPVASTRVFASQRSAARTSCALRTRAREVDAAGDATTLPAPMSVSFEFVKVGILLLTDGTTFFVSVVFGLDKGRTRKEETT